MLARLVVKKVNRSPAERVRFGKGRRSQHSAVFAVRRKRNGVCSLMGTKSKPNEMGSIWKGKTTPSVNRTPSAAADDLKHPNRSPTEWVRFGKEKQHHRSIGRRLRRLMTLWCCFDAGTPARARTGGLGLRRLALYPTELQTHTVYGRRNCAIVFYLLMCDAVKGAFRRRRRAFFRKRRCNRIHRVIFLAYMDESPVKLNRNIRMKEPCVIHGL